MKERINWQGPEYFHWEKNPEWYLAMGIVVLATAVASVIVGNYIFAILIVLAALALTIFSLRGPRIIDFEVNKRGLVIDKYFYSYKNLEAFWLDLEPQHSDPKILFKSQRIFLPYIHMPLSGVDYEELREFLGQYLEERELNEPLFQKIFETIGF